MAQFLISLNRPPCRQTPTVVLLLLVFLLVFLFQPKAFRLQEGRSRILQNLRLSRNHNRGSAPPFLSLSPSLSRTGFGFLVSLAPFLIVFINLSPFCHVVHWDNYPEVYYTILLPDGHDKQTVPDKLSALGNWTQLNHSHNMKH